MKVKVKNKGSTPVHEYDLKDGNLHFAKSDEWVQEIRGKKAVNFKSGGNGIEISINKKKIKLDFDEAWEVLITLAAHHTDELDGLRLGKQKVKIK